MSNQPTDHTTREGRLGQIDRWLRRTSALACEGVSDAPEAAARELGMSAGFLAAWTRHYLTQSLRNARQITP